MRFFLLFTVCLFTSGQVSYTLNLLQRDKCLICDVTFVSGQSQTFEELSAATEAIWAADVNRFPDNEVEYDLGSDEWVTSHL